MEVHVSYTCEFVQVSDLSWAGLARIFVLLACLKV